MTSPTPKEPRVRPPVAQSEIVRFLLQPEIYPWPADDVVIRETHGAMVFLAGDYALKIKKAVKFPYMDFSTLKKRQAACRREVELNRQYAPQLYLDAVPVTYDRLGRFALAGEGQIVEWCVLMKRFEEKDVLSSRLQANDIAADDIKNLADVVAKSHHEALPVNVNDTIVNYAGIIDGIVEGLKAQPLIASPETLVTFHKQARQTLCEITPILLSREQAGHIRRCHGDLHLNNIVIVDDNPILFDALEFDEKLATIDVLYDLAFVIMDMIVAGYDVYATQLLNQYLTSCRKLSELHAIRALPLFLALRAGIRAMVTADNARQNVGRDQDHLLNIAKNYFESACTFLQQRQPSIVAVGGFSGTGKSTLAAALAHALDKAPGAIHLRSDIERKALAGVKATDRLPDSHYTQDASRRVYAVLEQKASTILKAGFSVVIDAAFIKQNERKAVQSIATKLDVPFNGLWLTAPQHILQQRVTARKGDASDATSEVVTKQFAMKTGPVSWTAIDASGDANNTLQIAKSHLFPEEPDDHVGRKISA